MTLKLKKEKGSEVITSYLTNSNVNYMDLTDIYRLAISLGMLQQDRRWDFLGEFSGDASLVRSDGWSDWAECTRATKR